MLDTDMKTIVIIDLMVLIFNNFAHGAGEDISTGVLKHTDHEKDQNFVQVYRFIDFSLLAKCRIETCLCAEHDCGNQLDKGR